MKKYSKPALMTLSISANDQLCAGCGADAINDPALWQWLNDNNLDKGDVIGYFGNGECTQTVPGFETYCKLTPTESYRLFAS